MRDPDGGGAPVAPPSDTIFAPATGQGRAAVAIVRISGPAAHEVVRALTGQPPPRWRQLSLREIREADGALLDRAMVVAFPEGASYTGEAMAEIHCHGGAAVLSGVLERIAQEPGCRLAEPGEFTQRAFLAGRMDLSEVEGLGDLIAAETTGQHRQALRTAGGAVSRRTERWRALLLRAQALLEVTIDWADEEIPEDVAPEVRTILGDLQREMGLELTRAYPAERLRSGFEVAIVGPPNVGKSSLLNAIAGRDAAIVSEIAGTTRDVLEVRFDLAGLPVAFLDMAGLREAGDAIESIGVDRARRRATTADMRLFLSSADTPKGEAGDLWRAGDLRVWSKADLGPGDGELAISTRDETGIDALLEKIRQELEGRVANAGVFAHARQRMAVENARTHVGQALDMIGVAGVELAGEEVRLATNALDRLVGRIGVEDVLGEVFGAFCLGK